MTKKQIIKDDGRVLIYYHAPQTATAQQTEVYAEVAATEEPVRLGSEQTLPAKETADHV